MKIEFIKNDEVVLTKNVPMTIDRDHTIDETIDNLSLEELFLASGSKINTTNI